jgi:hypothetical protein
MLKYFTILLDVTFLYLYCGGILIIFLVSLLVDVSWSIAAKGALWFFVTFRVHKDRLCGLVVRVPSYRSRGPGSIPGSIRFSGK